MKYGQIQHFKPMMTSYQIKDNIKSVLQNSPPPEDTLCVTFGLNHLIKACVKPNKMVIPILSVLCLNHISRELLWP